MDESHDFRLKIPGILQFRRAVTNIIVQEFRYLACQDKKFGDAGRDGRAIHPLEFELSNK
jgi:hypothetical protein